MPEEPFISTEKERMVNTFDGVHDSKQRDCLTIDLRINHNPLEFDLRVALSIISNPLLFTIAFRSFNTIPHFSHLSITQAYPIQSFFESFSFVLKYPLELLYVFTAISNQ